MKRKVIILWYCFLTFLLSISLKGQKTINIEYEYNDRREIYRFTIRNTSRDHKTVILKFNRLIGVRANMSLPAMIEVKPNGVNRQFYLSKSGIARPDFSYSYKYYTGCIQPKPDLKVLYNLPLVPGKKTIPQKLSPVKTILGNKKPKNYNAVGFLMDKGDTVFAARRGTVEKVWSSNQRNPKDFFSSSVNYCVVRHDDCTLARYSNLEKDQVFVKPGELVEVGTPLGLVSSKPYNGDIEVRMSFYYFSVKNTIEKGEDRMTPEYFPVTFITEEGTVESWNYEKVYTPVLKKETIFQEMNRRERKRWKKRKEK